MSKFYISKVGSDFVVTQDNETLGTDGKPNKKKPATFKKDVEARKFISNVENGTLKTKK